MHFKPGPGVTLNKFENQHLKLAKRILKISIHFYYTYKHPTSLIKFWSKIDLDSTVWYTQNSPKFCPVHVFIKKKNINKLGLLQTFSSSA